MFKSLNLLKSLFLFKIHTLSLYATAILENCPQFALSTEFLIIQLHLLLFYADTILQNLCQPALSVEFYLAQLHTFCCAWKSLDYLQESPLSVDQIPVLHLVICLASRFYPMQFSELCITCRYLLVFILKSLV